jgi:hypothetical protein
MWFQGRVSVKLLKTGRIRIDYLDHSQLKAIVRFAYGFTGRDYRADPNDLDRLVGHIRQLGKVFGRYAIHLANEGITFDEATGCNILANDVEVR